MACTDQLRDRAEIKYGLPAPPKPRGQNAPRKRGNYKLYGHHNAYIVLAVTMSKNKK